MDLIDLLGTPRSPSPNFSENEFDISDLTELYDEQSVPEKSQTPAKEVDNLEGRTHKIASSPAQYLSSVSLNDSTEYCGNYAELENELLAISTRDVGIREAQNQIDMDYHQLQTVPVSSFAMQLHKNKRSPATRIELSSNSGSQPVSKTMENPSARETLRNSDAITRTEDCSNVFRSTVAPKQEIGPSLEDLELDANLDCNDLASDAQTTEGSPEGNQEIDLTQNNQSSALEQHDMEDNNHRTTMDPKKEINLNFENFEFTSAPIEIENDSLSAHGESGSDDGNLECTDIRMNISLDHDHETENSNTNTIIPPRIKRVLDKETKSAIEKSNPSPSCDLNCEKADLKPEELLDQCKQISQNTQLNANQDDDQLSDDEIWLPRKIKSSENPKQKKRKYKFVKKSPKTDENERSVKKKKKDIRYRKKDESTEKKPKISKSKKKSRSKKPVGLTNLKIQPQDIKLEIETISEGTNPSTNEKNTGGEIDEIDFSKAPVEKPNPLFDPEFRKLAEEKFQEIVKKRPIGCENCKRLYSKASKLVKHLSSEEGEMKCRAPPRKDHADTLVCNCCLMKFGTQAARQCHEMNLKYTPLRYKGILGSSDKNSKWGRGVSSQAKECYRCGKILAHNGSLFRHLQFVHNESRGADIMKAKMAEESSEVEKEEKPDPSEGFKCPDCARDFDDVASKDFHNCSFRTKRFIWLQTNGKYNCDKCEKSFEAPINIMNHYRIAHGKKVTCECCQKLFSFHTMTLHRKSKGLPPLGKKMVVAKKRRKRVEYTAKPCPFCEREGLFFPKRLKEHVRRCHKYDLERFCIHCYAALPTKQLLDNHIKTLHSDEIHCVDCGKFFVDKEFYENVHKARCRPPKKNNGVMNFVCKHCGRTYYREDNLKEHVKLEHESSETSLKPDRVQDT